MLAADAGFCSLSLALSRPEVEDAFVFLPLRIWAVILAPAKRLRGLRISGLIFFVWQGSFKSAIWFLLGLVVGRRS